MALLTYFRPGIYSGLVIFFLTKPEYNSLKALCLVECYDYERIISCHHSNE